METLNRSIHETLEASQFTVEDPAVACSLVVRHQTLLRNKRCTLAYLLVSLISQLSLHLFSSFIQNNIFSNISGQKLSYELDQKDVVGYWLSAS